MILVCICLGGGHTLRTEGGEVGLNCESFRVGLVYLCGYCYIVIYTFMQHHNDTIIKTHEGRKTQENFFRKIFTSHFIASVRKGCSRFACERVLETEHKLHILTPLLWPSRCVLFSWCWGPLHRGFPRAPSVGCGLPLPHLVSTVWNYTGNCLGPKLNWVK